MDFRFLLIHSPLVGALTWQPTSEVLRTLNRKVFVPRLSNPSVSNTLYFESHRAQVLDQIPTDGDGPFLVVGHSGAGALLPLLLQSLGEETRLVFVDSDLPHRGRSRFDLFPGGLADRWRERAENDNLPALWAEEGLAGLIVREDLRERFASELRPTPIRVYEEPMPLDGPGGGSGTAYVMLSKSYSQAYAEAERLGWVQVRRDSTHFHMINEPQDMAEILCSIGEQLD